MQSLRSICITQTSPLLRIAPSPCSASVLSPSWGLHLDFSLNIRATGSHVPRESLDQSHATFMPEAAQAVSRYPLNLSRALDRSPVLTSPLLFRRLIEWFAYARLSESYLPRSNAATFSSTLTTMAFGHSNLRWFEACSCKPAPRGLPSSLVKHCSRASLSRLHSQHTVSDAGDSHPHALPEPDVNLSAHPAPIIEPQDGIRIASARRHSENRQPVDQALLQPGSHRSQDACTFAAANARGSR